MAWKFFRIGAANDEIVRLETEVANRDKKISELEAEKKAMAENDSGVAGQAEGLKAELDDANLKIAQLEKDRDQLKADLEAEKKSVDKKASSKALEITAGQGQAPIKPGTANPATAGGGDIIAQLNSIEDPTERTVFYRKNKAAIDAAYSSAKAKSN